MSKSKTDIIYNAELAQSIQQDNVTTALQTIKDFLRWAYAMFNRADIYYGHGCDNSWDEALQLVLGGLSLPIDLPQELFDARLTQSEKETVVAMLLERIQCRKPVAYITNTAWFCGLDFYVDENSIIPRSPIGSLIAEKFSCLGITNPRYILDLCTGSGCIAIACAKAFPEAEVDAVDLSAEALNIAEINVQRHNVDSQVFTIQSDLFSNIMGQQYDLIVTNPPYVDAVDLADMSVEFHYEPALSLGSGEDGLMLTKQILCQSADYLTDNGWLVCEVGNSMLSLMEQYPNTPFQWLELKQGGVGVFALNKADLLEFKSIYA